MDINSKHEINSYLDIDGNLLQLFLFVFEENSVTRAAERLGITQSAVSHGMNKLRKITNDPLFVRSGRGITPTHTAEQIIEGARNLLRDMRTLSQPRGFDLKSTSGKFTIAGSDAIWEPILSSLHIALRDEAPMLDLRIVNADPNSAIGLREGNCDLLLTPIIPQGIEFKQQKLFEDEFVCFFDPEITSAPKSLDDYLSRKHARIVFSSIETTPIDQFLASIGKHRRVSIQVSSFSGLPSLMKGTDVIAILPSLLKKSIMTNFGTTPAPIPVDPLEFYQIWHSRDDENSLHRWVRQYLKTLTLKF